MKPNLKNYSLLAKFNDYAYGVWFQVVGLDEVCNEVVIYDHLLEEYQTFIWDEKIEFRGVEIKKEVAE